MAFVTIEDMIGSIELLVFPKIYQKYSKFIVEDNIVLVKGRISVKEEEQPKIIVDSIEPLKKLSTEVKKLYLRLDDSTWRNKFEELKPILLQHRGICPIYVFLPQSRKKLMAAREMWVDISDELLNKLKEKIGEDNVKMG